MKPPKTKDRDYVLPKPISHILILYRIVDLGTQEGTYKGTSKFQRKIRFDFEIADEFYTFEEKEIPMTVSKTYTYSFYGSSHLLADLEAWRGKFKPGETDSNNPNCFDIETMLGKAVSGKIDHITYEDGTTIAVIKNLQEVYQGVEVPELIRSLISLILEPERFDWNTYNSLPEHLQSKIALSPEFQEITSEGFKEKNDPDSTVNPPEESPKNKSTTETDDGVPFV